MKLNKDTLKTYVLYHLKWQSGFFIVYPTLSLCSYFHFPLWESMICSGFTGACVFWYIDKWIFSRMNKNDRV